MGWGGGNGVCGKGEGVTNNIIQGLTDRTSHPPSYFQESYGVLSVNFRIIICFIIKIMMCWHLRVYEMQTFRETYMYQLQVLGTTNCTRGKMWHLQLNMQQLMAQFLLYILNSQALTGSKVIIFCSPVTLPKHSLACWNDMQSEENQKKKKI